MFHYPWMFFICFIFDFVVVIVVVVIIVDFLIRNE